MNLKPLSLNFEYKNQIITYIDEPYKTLLEQKNKAIKRLNIKNTDIHCFYLGRDLTEYESQKIGDIFRNREKVTIKLSFPKQKSLSKNNSRNSNASNYLFLNTISNNPNLSKNYHEHLRRSMDEKENYYSKRYVLPPLKNSMKYLLSNNISNLIHNDSEIKEICSSCHQNNISEYCRRCKMFLCNECKSLEGHDKHLFIHLDKNLESNIKLYGNILQADMEYFKGNNSNLIKSGKNKSSNFIDEILNSYDLKDKEHFLIKELKKVISLYEKIMGKLKNLLIKENQKNIKNLVENYDINAQKINDNINDCINKTKKNNTHNIKDFKIKFGLMSDNENKINNINKDLVKFHLIFEINNKIISTFTKIGKELNKLLDEKNYFNLSYVYSKKLYEILEDDDENNSKKNQESFSSEEDQDN